MEISISNQCLGCGICTKICPSHTFAFPSAESVCISPETEVKTEAEAGVETGTEAEDGVKAEGGTGADAEISSEECRSVAPETAEVQECTEISDELRKPQVVNINACIACGHCVCVCPADAITHSEFPKEKLHFIEKKFEPNWDAFQSLISARRSVRAFKKEKLAHETLSKILQAAEKAPTACNFRGVHWTVVTNSGTLSDVQRETIHFLEKTVSLMESPWAQFISKIAPFSEIRKNMNRLPLMKSLLTLSEKQDVILFNAPALLIAHYDPAGGRFAEIDAQLALQNATLAAVALGLGTFYTGFVTRASESNRAISKILHIPAKHKIAGGMAVGVPAVQYRYMPEREYPVVQYLD